MNVAFIPVRGGSKSIPLKNIKLINGRPLIYWVLDAAVGCSSIDVVYVATDSKEIQSVVEKYLSAKVQVVDRSLESATDTASTEFVMLEFAEKYEFSNIALIQATSPLLRAEDLTNGFCTYNQPGTDSVLSVVRQKRFMWGSSNGGTAYPINYDYLNRPRRQDFNGYLVENGAFYITSKAALLASKCRISGKIKTVEMPEETYFELDEFSDWLIIENLLKARTGSKPFNFSHIKMVLSDCDGVLTDGGMYYSEHGDELKKFNTKDGMGFSLLRKQGIITGIITGENTEIVRRRVVKLQLDELHMNVSNKLQEVIAICNKYGIQLDEVAYIGDDINDIEVIQAVGFGCSVNNALQFIKNAAKYVTERNGGEGAVREVADLILNARTLSRTN